MKNSLGVLLLCCFFVWPVSSRADASPLFDKVDAFLSQYVKQGQVKYSTIQSNQEELNGLVAALADFDLDELSDAARKAFWINAYNILVIHGVVQAYPIDSPMDVSGFFDSKTYLVAGDTLTLNQIENEKLRAQFGDPRIHFALVCAAQSCPPIISEAFHPEKLESQLDARTRSNLNDSNFIRVNKKEEKVYLSEIFKWYRDDFVTSERDVLDYINQYRNKKIPSTYIIHYYTYNWQLNEHK